MLYLDHRLLIAGRRKKIGGFTLVELLISLVLSSVIILASTKFLADFYLIYHTQQALVDMSTDANLSLINLKKTIYMADYAVPRTNNLTGSDSLSNILTTAHKTYNYSTPTIDCMGQPITTKNKMVQYHYIRHPESSSFNSWDLMCKVGNINDTLISNIQNLQIRYGIDKISVDAGGNILTNQSTTNMGSSTNSTQMNVADYLAANTPCNKKVDVCHIPPGNPANVNTINIACNAVKTHLGHNGDYMGKCTAAPNTPNPTPRTTDGVADSYVTANNLPSRAKIVSIRYTIVVTSLRKFHRKILTTYPIGSLLGNSVLNINNNDRYLRHAYMGTVYLHNAYLK